MNPDMDFHLVDLGRPEQIEQAFDEIQRQYGKVDVLINNGAIANFNKPIQQLTFEEFSRVIDVNLKGAFACSRRFIELNHSQPYGRIINIASTRWNQNESGWDAYGASKGGVCINDTVDGYFVGRNVHHCKCSQSGLDSG